MKKKKLTLENLSVQSFVTRLDQQLKKTAIGGISNFEGCSDNGGCETLPPRQCLSIPDCGGGGSLDPVLCSVLNCSHGGGTCPEISQVGTCVTDSPC